MLELRGVGTLFEKLSLSEERGYSCRWGEKAGKLGKAGFVGQKSAYPQVEPIKLPVPWSRLRSVGDSGLYVRGELEGVEVRFLVDTGADLTVIRAELYESLLGKNHVTLEQIPVDMAVADGRTLPFKGRGSFRLKIGELEVMHNVWVADIDVDALLGYDFLQRYNCTIDAGKGEVKVCGLQHDSIDEKHDGGRVVIAKTIVVPPESESVVAARVSDVEWAHEPAVVECNTKFIRRHQIMLAKVLVDPFREVVPLRMMNPTDNPITL